MSDGLNRVYLIGNLGEAPELRFTQGGQAVLNIRLATSESYVDKEGARKERTEWHTVVVWGARGEGLSKVLDKGDRIAVEGGLRTSSYEDKKTGDKRYKTEVVANEVVLCGVGRRDGKREDDRRGDERGREDDRRRDERSARVEGPNARGDERHASTDSRRDERRDDRRRDDRREDGRASSRPY